MLGRQALLWAPLPGPRTTRRLPLSNGMWPKGRQGRCLPHLTGVVARRNSRKSGPSALGPAGLASMAGV